MNIIEVVSAVIVHDGRILLTQRLCDKDFAYTWESPGGKVESGETHHDGLRRELFEEIGVSVIHFVDEPIFSAQFDGEVKRIERTKVHLYFYIVESFCGVPKPMEGQGIGWFSPNEMPHLNLAPGNARALETLQRLSHIWDEPA